MKDPKAPHLSSPAEGYAISYLPKVGGGGKCLLWYCGAELPLTKLEVEQNCAQRLEVSVLPSLVGAMDHLNDGEAPEPWLGKCRDRLATVIESSGIVSDDEYNAFVNDLPFSIGCKDEKVMCSGLEELTCQLREEELQEDCSADLDLETPSGMSLVDGTDSESPETNEGTGEKEESIPGEDIEPPTYTPHANQSTPKDLSWGKWFLSKLIQETENETLSANAEEWKREGQQLYLAYLRGLDGEDPQNPRLVQAAILQGQKKLAIAQKDAWDTQRWFGLAMAIATLVTLFGSCFIVFHYLMRSWESLRENWIDRAARRSQAKERVRMMKECEEERKLATKLHRMGLLDTEPCPSSTLEEGRMTVKGAKVTGTNSGGERSLQAYKGPRTVSVRAIPSSQSETKLSISAKFESRPPKGESKRGPSLELFKPIYKGKSVYPNLDNDASGTSIEEMRGEAETAAPPPYQGQLVMKYTAPVSPPNVAKGTLPSAPLTKPEKEKKFVDYLTDDSGEGDPLLDEVAYLE